MIKIKKNTEIIFLIGMIILTVFILSGCRKENPLDGSSWTAYTYLKDGKNMSTSEYVKSQQSDTVDIIQNISFDDDAARTVKQTWANKDGLELTGDEGSVILNKGDSVSNKETAKCKLMSDDKIVIGSHEYTYDKANDSLSTSAGDTTVFYIRDYGIKGRIFALQKAYKNGELIYDAVKDEKEKKDNRAEYANSVDGFNKITQYKFALDIGEALEDTGAGGDLQGEIFAISCKETPDGADVTISYDKEREEAAIYDRASDTLVVESNGVKRVFEPIGTTPLSDDE